MAAQRDLWERRLDQLDAFVTDGGEAANDGQRRAAPTNPPRPRSSIDRFFGAPVERVWAAWVTPEHLEQWFAPHPFTTTESEIDPRPGGVFRTVMRSPQGRDLQSVGCFLEVVEHERLAWTTVLGRGFRPCGPCRAAR